MRKLADLKNEEALEVVADILEPLTSIFGDKEFQKMRNAGKSRTEVASWAIKAHKQDIIKVLAAIDGEDYETYEISALALPIRILEIVNDPDLVSLFMSQGQITQLTSAGSATEITEAGDR